MVGIQSAQIRGCRGKKGYFKLERLLDLATEEENLLKKYLFRCKVATLPKQGSHRQLKFRLGQIIHSWKNRFDQRFNLSHV